MNISLNFSHLHSTFWYTLTSPDQWKRNWNWFCGLPLFFYFFLLFVQNTFGGEYFLSIVSLFSITHFLKQQVAWFQIASFRGKKRNKRDQLLDTIAIYSITWGFVLTSLAEETPRGWFIKGDLPEIPSSLYLPLLTISLTMGFIYLIRQFLNWYNTKEANLASLQIFICTFIIWGYCRLAETSALGFLLNQSHHTIPYFILGIIYMRSELKSGKKFWLPKIGFWKLITLLYIISWGLSSVEVGIQNPNLAFWDLKLDFFGPYSRYVMTALATLSLTHFTLDGIIWNSKHNPGWSKALDSVKSA
ncbi:MAG: hypothetical protein K2P81_17340 [Bacteriovoracaceae bacterium]|nr:hypothetical protein [Bacteriovoracaceae bacterium]